MKLYVTRFSPFGRKVRVFADETGQSDDIEIKEVDISPFDLDKDLNTHNPLGKIPCLITDDGQAIFDSRAICEYLDDRHGGEHRIPRKGSERWRAQRMHALCDGILDAVILGLYESRVRPESVRYQPWVDAQSDKAVRALTYLDKELEGSEQSADIVGIAAGCVLGYLEFRRPDMAWREWHPKLADWYDEFAKRPSMTKTSPSALGA